MTIYTPGSYGLILRKNERTRAFISKYVQAFLIGRRGATLHDLNQDEHLLGISVAESMPELASVVAELERDGAIRGEDFVATAANEGVIDPMPSWLTLVPTRKLYDLTPGT